MNFQLEHLTRYETPDDPPNYFIRTTGSDARQAFTKFPDPTPQLRKIKKELVTYKREDGVQLSMTLYLPPDYKPGERRPAVLWAYPLEFTDPTVASQVTGSSYRFTTISGPSHLFFLLRGFVVLDGATMPVVGDPETVNNTLGVLLKYRDDIERVSGEEATRLVAESKAAAAA